jgi:hypothetical protein
VSRPSSQRADGRDGRISAFARFPLSIGRRVGMLTAAWGAADPDGCPLQAVSSPFVAIYLSLQEHRPGPFSVCVG